MGGTDKYHRLATNEGDTLYLFLYHYYIGGIDSGFLSVSS